MNYKGIVIKESLENPSILEGIKAIETVVEPVTPEHKTPWLKQWTMLTLEIPDNRIESLSKLISQSFSREHPKWFADFKSDKYHYIIFAGKVFKVNLLEPSLFKDARDFGISIGIPEYQLDFAPKDKKWER